MFHDVKQCLHYSRLRLELGFVLELGLGLGNNARYLGITHTLQTLRSYTTQ